MINNYKDIKKPYYVAKSAENTVFHYGEITEGQVLSTKMPIYTFKTEEQMIFFVQENGGIYIEPEEI
jgi:hypothetical protein